MHTVVKFVAVSLIASVGAAMVASEAKANVCTNGGIVWGNTATCGTGGAIWGKGEWVLVYDQTYGWQVSNQILHVELRATGTYARAQGTYDNGAVISQCYAEDNTYNFISVQDTYGCAQWGAERFNLSGQYYP
jgi:hypothetical protein